MQNSQTVKYSIGRYYFSSIFRDLANKDFLDSLKKQPYISEGNYEFAIGNIGEETAGDFQLIRGTFGRVKKGSTAEIYDKEKLEFKKSSLPEVADIMLEFIIVHELHLVFVQHNTKLPFDSFAQRFKQIYKGKSVYGDIEIDAIFEESNIYSVINGWDKVTSVVFKKLRPSNPSSDDSFEEIERLIKDTGSENIDLTIHPNGIDKNERVALNIDSLLIKQALSLSAHGYGEAKFIGEDDSTKVIVQTKKFPKAITLDFSLENVFGSLIKTLNEFKGHEKENAYK